MEIYDEKTPAHILRGLYATPIICELSKLGIFTKASNKINLRNKAKIKNNFVLNLCLDYLVHIGVLLKKTKNYELSEMGYEIFRRSNSFFVPHSYREVILNIGNILTNKKTISSCKVDRNENILGSGLTHLRYFFQPINYCNSKIDYNSLIDLGCGNGHFVNEVLKRKKNIKVVGIDLSPDSVKTCKKNITKYVGKDKFRVFKADISKVKLWKNKITKFLKGTKPLLSLWFMLHEISNHKVKNLKIFLLQVYQSFPESSIIVGEIVRLEDKTLKFGLLSAKKIFTLEIAGTERTDKIENGDGYTLVKYKLGHNGRISKLTYSFNFTKSAQVYSAQLASNTIDKRLDSTERLNSKFSYNFNKIQANLMLSRTVALSNNKFGDLDYNTLEVGLKTNF